MKIEWHKVTGLSKTIALILFIALPFIGFYFGAVYGVLVGDITKDTSVAPGVITTSSVNNGTEYYMNTAEWQKDGNNAAFSIAYPIDFDTQDTYNTKSGTDAWRVNDVNPGSKYFSLVIPRAFEPQTNFADATLTVGSSNNSKAVAQCLAPDASGGPATATTTATINGVPFTVFHASDAGAGNYYETASYRAMRNGTCWAVEYTIHSSQIANYPAEYNLQPFDKSKLTGLLDRIVNTFTFL